MVDPEIIPSNAANAGCMCALVDSWSTPGTTSGNVTYTASAILVHEAPGWKFDHIDVYYEDSSGEFGSDRYFREQFLAIENGGLRLPENGTPHETHLWPIVETEAELLGDPYFIRVSRAVAAFVEVGTGKILHGSSGTVLCGKAGLPLFDNKNGAY